MNAKGQGYLSWFGRKEPLGCLILLAILTGCNGRTDTTSYIGLSQEALEHLDAIIMALRGDDLADEKNAFPLLRKAAALSAIPEEQRSLYDSFHQTFHSPRKEVSDDLVEYLARNEEAFALIDRAVALNRCQIPILITTNGVVIDHLGELRHLARLKTVRASVRMHNGMFDEARADLKDILSVTRMMMEGGGSTLHKLTACAIRESCVYRTASLLASADPGGEATMDMIRAIERLPAEMAEHAELAFRSEYRNFLATLRILAEDALEDGPRAVVGTIMPDLHHPTRWVVLYDEETCHDLRAAVARHDALDIIETQKLAAIWLDDAILRIAEPWTFVNERLIFPFPGEARYAERPNVIGQFLVNYLPSVDALRTHFLRERASLEASLTVMAIHVYAHLHGSLPDDLEELVREGILEKVPQDPYSDRRLGYMKPDRIIWSVGPDGRNQPDVSADGGRKSFQWRF